MARKHPICEQMTDALDRLIEARDWWQNEHAKEKAKKEELRALIASLKRCGTCRLWHQEHGRCTLTNDHATRRDTCDKWEIDQ